jgi:Holliday junction resolvase RusA-like endonuclease
MNGSTKNKIEFLVPGEPVAQIRPRFSARLVNGKIITNVRRDQPEQEGYFIQMIEKQLPDDFQIFTGPVILHIDCRLRRPKSHYRAGKYSHLIKPSAPLFPQKTPDWDNLGKFVSDCFNKLIYEDDKQVIDARVQRFYSKTPCTIIKASELDIN